MSIRQAVKEYHVPFGILARRHQSTKRAENYSLGPQERQMADYVWLSSLLRHNPDLSIWKSEGLSAARAKGLSRRTIVKFYHLLKTEIISHKLQQSPQHIVNSDESGLQLINSTGNVVVAKGTRNGDSLSLLHG
ncbi:ig(immunoglobulin) and lrr(leucine rich repeat) domain [Holotrichia oblita]|uniref:Ig(Immunoglobulin) and lrr(Leucine rich repeat) domain n=1 Tax=Holotrichia oblita TaxID=644536 RepID=A0ACB9T9I8_HOLOL|nr:ig(immunoglobulin) and lrr(leucine rich repeat) domain [Holotrichia oblita]